jgi:hypothetical protein
MIPLEDPLFSNGNSFGLEGAVREGGILARIRRPVEARR